MTPAACGSGEEGVMSRRQGLEAAVYWLDVVATSLVLFILIVTQAFRSDVFMVGGEVAIVGWLMLAGCAVILAFDLTSTIWLKRTRPAQGARPNAGLVWLGAICLVLLAAEKVMADEVAHEAEAAWTIQGEYLILYCMLFLQFVYNILVVRQLVRRPAGLVGADAAGSS